MKTGSIFFGMGLGLTMLLTSPGTTYVSNVSLNNRTLKIELTAGGTTRPVAVLICNSQNFMDQSKNIGRIFFGLRTFSTSETLYVDKFDCNDKFAYLGSYTFEPDSIYLDDEIRIEHIDIFTQIVEKYGSYSRPVAYLEVSESDVEALLSGDSVVAVLMGNTRVKVPCEVIFCNVYPSSEVKVNSQFLTVLFYVLMLGILYFLVYLIAQKWFQKKGTGPPIF